MTSGNDLDDEESKAMEEAFERSATPHPSVVLRSEHNDDFKGRPRNIALDIWGPSIEEQILRHLDAPKTNAEILPFAKTGNVSEE